MPWRAVGTLEVMASARAPEAVFWSWRFLRTTPQAPALARAAFLAIKSLTTEATLELRPVTEVETCRASSWVSAEVPETVLVLLWRAESREEEAEVNAPGSPLKDLTAESRESTAELKVEMTF